MHDASKATQRSKAAFTNFAFSLPPSIRSPAFGMEGREMRILILCKW
jgi:hypothetical protein